MQVTVVSTMIDREVDKFVLGSSPYSPDAPRPYCPLCSI